MSRNEALVFKLGECIEEGRWSCVPSIIAELRYCDKLRRGDVWMIYVHSARHEPTLALVCHEFKDLITEIDVKFILKTALRSRYYDEFEMLYAYLIKKSKVEIDINAELVKTENLYLVRKYVTRSFCHSCKKYKSSFQERVRKALGFVDGMHSGKCDNIFQTCGVLVCPWSRPQQHIGIISHLASLEKNERRLLEEFECAIYFGKIMVARRIGEYVKFRVQVSIDALCCDRLTVARCVLYQCMLECGARPFIGLHQRWCCSSNLDELRCSNCMHIFEYTEIVRVYRDFAKLAALRRTLPMPALDSMVSSSPPSMRIAERLRPKLMRRAMQIEPTAEIAGSSKQFFHSMYAMYAEHLNNKLVSM